MRNPEWLSSHCDVRKYKLWERRHQPNTWCKWRPRSLLCQELAPHTAEQTHGEDFRCREAHIQQASVTHTPTHIRKSSLRHRAGFTSCANRCHLCWQTKILLPIYSKLKKQQDHTFMARDDQTNSVSGNNWNPIIAFATVPLSGKYEFVLENSE